MRHLEESDEKENNDLDPGSSSAKESQGCDDGITESNNYFPASSIDIHAPSNNKSTSGIGEDLTVYPKNNNYDTDLCSPISNQNKYARITASRSINMIMANKSCLDQADSEVVLQDKFQIHDVRNESSFASTDGSDSESAISGCDDQMIRHRQEHSNRDNKCILSPPVDLHQSHQSNSQRKSIQSDLNCFSNSPPDISSLSSNQVESSSCKQSSDRTRINTAEYPHRFLSGRVKLVNNILTSNYLYSKSNF